MNYLKIKNLFYLIIISFFIGCEGDVGPQGVGLNSLTDVTSEPAGSNCENGGVKIEVGTDINENGVLDSEEILSTSFVCNGIDGNTSLTNVTSEPASENCQNGGIKIDSGVDTNRDGTLDDTEITATAYVCNGSDGNNSLSKITNEAAGSNCENGGLKIDTGVDRDSDGMLDDSEINATAYICNGIDGNNSLSKITSEAAGTNCENGGLKIDTGVDSDSDGMLDDSEITATTYACNGLNGNISLVNITDEASGSNCENGGVRIDSGVDEDDDGTLDSDEIQVTKYICNGKDTELDREIIIKFPGSGYAYGTESPTAKVHPEVILNSFNITNYSEIDSIVFQSYLKTEDTDVKCYVALFDVTNGNVISNSFLSSNSISKWEWVTTTINFIDEMPTSKISLGIGVRSEQDGTYVSYYLPEIRLYRNH